MTDQDTQPEERLLLMQWAVHDGYVLDHKGNAITGDLEDIEAVRSAQGAIVVLRQEVEAERRELGTLRESNQRFRTTISHLENDLQIVAEELREEAVRRDWCGEYGEWIKNVNSRTSQEWLLHCDVSSTYRLVIDFTLTASDEAHLSEGIREARDVIDRAMSDLEAAEVSDFRMTGG